MLCYATLCAQGGLRSVLAQLELLVRVDRQQRMADEGRREASP